MPTKQTATSRLTAKQRACPHPPQHVHPTYDDRWETCDLCHIIRAAPLPAPWIVAWDESQPAEEPPALFEHLTQPTHVPVPKRRPAVTLRESDQAPTYAEWRAIVERDSRLLGPILSWRFRSPDLDDVYTPDQIATCHRCHGVGTIQDRTELHPGYPYPSPHHIPDPDAAARTCPRCQGAGRIPKYTA